jgi:hypothetical protein
VAIKTGREVEQLTIDGNDDGNLMFEVEVVVVVLLIDLEEKLICFGRGRCESEFSLWARRLSSTVASLSRLPIQNQASASECGWWSNPHDR